VSAKVVFLAAKVKVGQVSHITLDHHRLACVQHLQQCLSGLARAGGGVRFDDHAGALTGNLLHAGLGHAPPADEGRLPFEVPIAKAHPRADAQQHVLAHVVVVVGIDVAHRAGDAVMGLQGLESV
jgi:hypothetical protein